MRIKVVGLIAAFLCAAAVLPSQAADKRMAVLAGHAILPGRTLIPAPDDAPDAMKVSGKYTGETPIRLDKKPTDGARLPFNGQSIQGFSSIKTLDDGTFLVLTDNGFGAKVNSPDAMLMFHHIRPDFETGAVEVLKTTFLSDPDKVIPFLIANEATDKRYLTGSDLDIESFQPIGKKLFIGDEFGPYLVVVDRESGKVEAFFEAFLGETKIRSPDHYELRLLNPHVDGPPVNLGRSRGFEGLAASPDHRRLYALLEGPIWNPAAETYETLDESPGLRILEFDARRRRFTGRSWLYRLEANGNSIGDFNMIDKTRGLIIERDGGEGDAEQACGERTKNCFTDPARFKRVYLIDLQGIEDGEAVRKVSYIDLLDIRDPDGIARAGKRKDGRFTFPFVTIEDVDVIDETHIIVANDNNFPFSKGRSPTSSDDNEFILLDVVDFLNAR